MKPAKPTRLTLTEEDVWGMTSQAAPLGERAIKDRKKGVGAGMSGGRSVSGKRKSGKSPRVSQQEGQ